MSRIFKEEEYAVRRNEILTVARRLVYTKGYEQMTIQDILDDLRISKGAFYHYFDSKQDLLESLTDRMIDEGLSLIEPIVQDARLSALEKMHTYFSTGAQWKTAQKDYLLAMMRVWYADDNAIVRQKMFGAMIRRVAPQLTAIIRQGVDEEVFHMKEPDLAGEVILSMWTSLGDLIVGLVLARPPEKGALSRLKRIVDGYIDAMERVLGAAPGSLNLFDPTILKEWLPPPEGDLETEGAPKEQVAG